LHPTNVLLYELWRYILIHLSINIDNYQYNFGNNQLINFWYSPFTSKMVKDLDIKFTTIIDDNFYIERYEKNVLLLASAGDKSVHVHDKWTSEIL
jgi:hypothetical protein